MRRILWGILFLALAIVTTWILLDFGAAEPATNKAEPPAQTAVDPAREAPTPLIDNQIQGRVLTRRDRLAAPAATVALIGAFHRRYETQTDAEGLFSFSMIAPGRYQLTAQKDGMYAHGAKIPTLSLGQRDRIGPLTLFLEPAPEMSVVVRSVRTGEPIAGARVVAENGTRIAMETGEDGRASTRAPAGIWRIEVTAPHFLIKSAAIGHPFSRSLTVDLEPAGSLSGMVNGGEGKGLSGVVVTAEYGATRFGSRTDDDGAYQIDHIPLEKRYFVSVTAPGRQFFRVEGPILTEENPRGRLDLHPKPNPNLKMNRLSGWVEDEWSQPIQAAHLVFATPDDPEFIEVWSEPDGSFTMENLDPRSWAKHIMVEAKGFAAQQIRIPTEAEPAPLSIVLAPGHFVSGVIRDQLDNPITGAIISAGIAGSPYRLFSGEEILSDSAGRFFLDSLGDDVYFDVAALGFTDLRNQKWRLDRSDHVIILREPGVIIGRVLESDLDRPITRFLVKAEFENGIPFPGAENWPSSGIAFHDLEGVFRIDGLASGQSMNLAIVAADRHPQTVRLSAVPEADAEPVLIRLPRSGRQVAGTVSDQDGEPAVSVEVTLLVYSDENARAAFSWEGMARGLPGEHIARRETRTTDQSGSFSFENVNADQPLDLILTGDGYARTRFRDLETEPYQALAELSLSVSRAAVIRGMVSREKYPDAKHLTLRRLDGTPLDLAQALTGDQYAFQGLPPGAYQIVLFRGIAVGEPGDKTVTRTGIRIEAGQTSVVNFDAKSLRVVSGQILTDGQPMKNGVVFLVGSSDLLSNPRTETDAQGLFRFNEVSEGIYDLVAYPGQPDTLNYLSIMRHFPNRETIQIKDDDFFERFFFSGASRVLGKIDPAPSENWLLFLKGLSSDPETPLIANEPEKDGRFIFEAVPPGGYRLMFRPRFSAETGTRVLLSELTIAPGDVEIDLGIVQPPAGNARLRIFPDGARSTARPKIRLRASPEGMDPTEPAHAVYQGSGTLGQEGLLLKGMPEGRFTVSVSVIDGGYRVLPQQTAVVLADDGEAVIYLSLEPMTCLTFVNKTPGREITAAVLSGNGQRIRFDPVETGSPPESPYSDEPRGYFTGRTGIAWHVPEGTWRLDVFSHEKRWSTDLTIKQATPTNVSVFFDP